MDKNVRNMTDIKASQARVNKKSSTLSRFFPSRYINTGLPKMIAPLTATEKTSNIKKATIFKMPGLVPNSLLLLNRTSDIKETYAAWPRATSGKSTAEVVSLNR